MIGSINDFAALKKESENYLSKNLCRVHVYSLKDTSITTSNRTLVAWHFKPQRIQLHICMEYSSFLCSYTMRVQAPHLSCIQQNKTQKEQKKHGSNQKFELLNVFGFGYKKKKIDNSYHPQKTLEQFLKFCCILLVDIHLTILFKSNVFNKSLNNFLYLSN